MIARYDGEKLNDYVIEGLAESESPFSRQSELFAATCWVNDGSPIDARIEDIYVDNHIVRKKKEKSKITVLIARIN